MCIRDSARIVDGIAMMPVRAIGEAMGLKVTYDPKYDSVVCSVGSDQVIFNANSAYTCLLYTSYPSLIAPFVII